MWSYRFARFDAQQRYLDEVSLDCLSDADALLVGGRLAWRVEVRDHNGRPVGVAGPGADAGASAASAAASDPTREPVAFNPFSRRAWRRRHNTPS